MAGEFDGDAGAAADGAGGSGPGDHPVLPLLCVLWERCAGIHTVPWLSHRCFCVTGLHPPPHPRNHGPAASHGEPDSHHDGAGSCSDCE